MAVVDISDEAQEARRLAMQRLTPEQLAWVEGLALRAYRTGVCEGIVVMGLPWTVIAVIVLVVWWMG